MVLAEPVQVTRLIAEVFERFQIPYFVGGSLASSLHGVPRVTQDVHMVADLKPQHIAPLVEALETTCHVDADMVRDAIQRRSSFNIIHLATMFKVDIFVFQDDRGSQEGMARREKYELSEEPHEELFVATAEDIILYKLHWFQLGGGVSERQWNDVSGVLQVQKEKVHLSYLQQAAKHMGVKDLLEQAFSDSGIEVING